MAFVFKKDEAAAEKVGQSGGMRTGVYDVTIKAVILKQDKSGNNRATFIFENSAGKRALVFDMCIDEKWTTGKDNVDYAKWQEFVAVTGMKTGATKTAKVKMSEKNTEECTVFTEPLGQVVKIAFQEVYDEYQNKEKIEKQIHRTLFATGHTVSEKKLGAKPAVVEALTTDLKPYYTKAHIAAKANGTLIVDSKDSKTATAGSAEGSAAASSDDDDDIL